MSLSGQEFHGDEDDLQLINDLCLSHAEIWMGSDSSLLSLLYRVRV